MTVCPKLENGNSIPFDNQCKKCENEEIFSVVQEACLPSACYVLANEDGIYSDCNYGECLLEADAFTCSCPNFKQDTKLPCTECLDEAKVPESNCKCTENQIEIGGQCYTAQCGANNSCSQHGQCTLVDKNAVCICNEGFEGEYCEFCYHYVYEGKCIKYNCLSADSTVCGGEANGTCQYSKEENSMVCKCADGYDMLTRCETCDVNHKMHENECKVNKCDCSNEFCQYTGEVFECVCEDPFDYENYCKCKVENGVEELNCACAKGWKLENNKCIKIPQRYWIWIVVAICIALITGGLALFFEYMKKKKLRKTEVAEYQGGRRPIASEPDQLRIQMQGLMI